MSQGLGVSVHSTTVGVRPRSQLELVRSRKVRKYSVRVNGAGSVDYGTEDEDIRLIREFESLKNKVDPQNNVRRAAHLELLWSMSEVRLHIISTLFLKFTNTHRNVAHPPSLPLPLPCLRVAAQETRAVRLLSRLRRTRMPLVSWNRGYDCR